MAYKKNEQDLKRRRDRYAADPEERKRSNEYSRAYNAANKERIAVRRRQKYLAEREVFLARAHRNYWAGIGRLRAEMTTRLWQEQGERCYLCEDALPLEKMILEHDHRCCGQRNFCRNCIRGAACRPCNKTLGMAYDDVDRLERIARNLRTAVDDVSARLAVGHRQLALGLEEGAA
jgi:Recombination endonuclease VII